MQRNQRQHEAFEVLQQVVKHLQALGILALRHVRKRPKLRCYKGNMLLPQHDLELLPPNFIWIGPVLIALPGSLTSLLLHDL